MNAIHIPKPYFPKIHLNVVLPLLALIALIILGEEYKPCSSSLCSFLQPPVTSSLIKIPSTTT
jgi:hypothetical protein